MLRPARPNIGNIRMLLARTYVFSFSFWGLEFIHTSNINNKTKIIIENKYNALALHIRARFNAMLRFSGFQFLNANSIQQTHDVNNTWWFFVKESSSFLEIVVVVFSDWIFCFASRDFFVLGHFWVRRDCTGIPKDLAITLTKGLQFFPIGFNKWPSDKLSVKFCKQKQKT